MLMPTRRSRYQLCSCTMYTHTLYFLVAGNVHHAAAVLVREACADRDSSTRRPRWLAFLPARRWGGGGGGC
jgi:hypothetical protein